MKYQIRHLERGNPEVTGEWTVMDKSNETPILVQFLDYILGQDPTARVNLDYGTREVEFQVGCDAGIRPFPGNTELSCQYSGGEHKYHKAVLEDYAYPGSRTEVQWLEDDRRNFHGDYPGICPWLNCVLPKNHRDDHAF